MDNIEHLPAAPDVERGFLYDILPSAAPTRPEAWTDIEKDIHDILKPGLVQYNSPRVMAYWPVSISYPSILGELYSAAFNQAVFNWSSSPGIVELEARVLEWLRLSLGLPECFSNHGSTGGGAMFLSGASEALAICMVAARNRHMRRLAAKNHHLSSAERALETSRLVALASDQAHSCAKKGANIAGVHHRTVETQLDNQLTMTGHNLLKSLQHARQENLEPFFVTITLGTTSTCAIDDLESIAEVANSEEWEHVWFHIDAAYLGSALICPEYHGYSKHFDAFDSFDFNIQKWLPVNIEAR